jgi:hypothetical protein
MSSGNSRSPADGKMLYFSLTVCVFTSSSLPALEGALESSKGDAKGPSPYLLALLPALSDDHEVLRELKPLCDGSRTLSSSLNRRVRVLVGGKRCSAESCIACDCPAYNPGAAAPLEEVSEREDGWRVACGRTWESSCRSSRWSSLPELMRM